MKTVIKISLFLILPIPIQGQQPLLDSLHAVLANASNDTIRMDAYKKLGVYYDDVNLDSSVFYSEKGRSIAEQLQLKLDQAEMLMDMCFPLTKMGNYPQSLKVLMQASEITSNPLSEKNLRHLGKGQTPRTVRLTVSGYIQLGFGYLYSSTGYHEKQIAAYFDGIRIAESIKDTTLLCLIYGDMSGAYMSIGKLDSALFFGQKASQYFLGLPLKDRKFTASIFSIIGSIYQQMGNLNLARENFQKAIQVSEAHINLGHAGDAYLSLASLCQILKKPDSSLFFAKKALQAHKSVGDEMAKAIAYRTISELYREQGNEDSSLAFLKLATALNDSLERQEKKKLQEYQVVGFNEQLRLQELDKEKIAMQTRIRTYAMLAGIGLFMLIAFLLYKNNINRKKANELLQKQNKEIEFQKKNVEEALTNLRSTQAQLIQSEKMASLGELTAGIAHEIQNPLNFVNNFSEVNAELLDDMRQEISKGNHKEANSIAADIRNNLEKITFHGQRADAIVKSMLQHSRNVKGTKELTDINALADEYLRLSYHNMRAKDKAFNTSIQTDFDDTIGKINIIPQDVGRALLNLFNNAFYYVDKKRSLNISEYEPTVSVATKKLNGKVHITIKDNGIGIPEKYNDKIFQPFFTTKPAGTGTGLGLSLSYDIITKEHGGEITVESKAGEGAEFVVLLPV